MKVSWLSSSGLLTAFCVVLAAPFVLPTALLMPTAPSFLAIAHLFCHQPLLFWYNPYVLQLFVLHAVTVYLQQSVME